jgi:uncharacterized protein (DUF1015 family)
MADVRPLPGIRFTSADHLAALVTPPYDVISPEAQSRYYERDPHNVVRLELGREEPNDDDLDNRYTRAAATFAEWRRDGVLAQDPPQLYLYEQRFAVAGSDYRRLALLARVRLESWEAGVILPHEHTLSKPKNDRLKLLRACAANLSPLMVLYDDPEAQLAALLQPEMEAPAHADFADEAGEQHRLWPLQDEALAARAAEFFRDRQLYIADGHHRYETALTYRDEQHALRHDVPEDDASNFTLMALSAIEDAGLVVLPTHRVLRDLDPVLVAGLGEQLSRYFVVTPLDTPDAEAALTALAEAGENGTQGSAAFVVAGPNGLLLLRLSSAGRQAMSQLPSEHADTSTAWRALDLAILHELVLRRGLGITDEQVRAGKHISYTRDAAAALAAVRARPDGTTLAVLVRPTPPVAIRDVARAGDRMPQKSTYFYPKLITGLVINPVW